MDHSQHAGHENHAGHEGHSGHAGHTSTQPTSMADMHAQHGSAGASVLEISIILMVFALFGAFYFRKKVRFNSTKIDLLKNPVIRSLVRWKYFSFSIRLIPMLLLISVILSGLIGHPRSGYAAGMTWLFWWTVLIFFIAFAGKIFCAICPWDFFANLVQFAGFNGNKKFSGSLKKKWPKILSNIYPAIIMFILLTWLELGFEITTDSYFTAVLGLLVVAMAVVSALVFEKRSFCRYACPVGRVSGLYAQFSPLEVRARDSEVCRKCKTKECVLGSDTTTSCPTGQIPYKMKENTYCTMCTECVRSCNKSNMTVNIRSFASDLIKGKGERRDEGVMALFMASLTFFHGLSMTPIWFSWTDKVEALLGWNYLAAFSVLMGVILVLSFYFYLLFIKGLRSFFGIEGVSWKLAFTLIPLTLGYHLGHNSMHLFSESVYLVPMINDPFGWGWNLFGMKGYQPASVISHGSLKYLQYLCIGFGFYYSVKVLNVRVKAMAKIAKDEKRLYFSFLAVLVTIAAVGIWFVNQPMVMKS